MQDQFIHHEITLLLAKYGKQTVIEALARRLEISEPELRRALDGILTMKPRQGKREKPSTSVAVEQVLTQTPEKAGLIRVLITRFHNRTFLPELKDVRRFFEQHSHGFASVRSRSDSLPRLVRLLAETDKTELSSLTVSQGTGPYSSLGLISDEILRRTK